MNDIIGKLEGQDCRNIIDYAQYKVDWLIGLLLRIGGSLEESILPYLLQANQLLLTSDTQSEEISSIALPPLLKTGFREDQGLIYLSNNSPTFLTTGLK